MINIRFNLQRVKNIYDMPLINVAYRNTQIQCLIDTGACVPVWCSGEEELKSYYANQILNYQMVKVQYIIKIC